MLPSLGPFPAHQKMQLEAVSQGIRALGSAFPAHTEPALNPQEKWELAAVATSWPRSTSQFGFASWGLWSFSLWVFRRLSYCPVCEMGL